MSNEDFMQQIPRYGNAGVAFLGVEVKDTYLLIACVFVGLVVGARVGAIAYIGIPLGGYFITTLYLDWKDGQLPGSLSAFLYTKGIRGYSPGLSERNVIYHGDAVIMNKGFEEQEKEMLAPYLKAQNGLK
jgi:uncharacterized membrane-anchored protein YitT (DUF2179 family)